MKKINFNVPNIPKFNSIDIKKAFKSENFINSGYFYGKCINLIKKKINAPHAFLTNSCTSAIEAALLAINLKKNDEVIIQSYTFVSIVDILFKLSLKFNFCDIDKHFVIDLEDLKKKINKNTRVIILTHYNGNSVNFDYLKQIIKNKKIIVIEDAAQSYGAKFKKSFLGSIGDFAAFSFHQTKNLHCGSGGALILNNKKFYNNLIKVLDRGTNKSDFLNQKSNKYTWVSQGVSSSITEMQSVFLMSQLKIEKEILRKRKIIYNYYRKFILSDKKYFEISSFKNFNSSNYHMFYLILKNKMIRKKLMNYLSNYKIQSTSHYEPLHLSHFSKKNINIKKKLPTTEKYSQKILRLPLHLKLNENNIKFISNKINRFFKEYQ